MYLYTVTNGIYYTAGGQTPAFIVKSQQIVKTVQTIDLKADRNLKGRSFRL